MSELIDLLDRLQKFKPKYIRWCKCETATKEKCTQMKYHPMYKCKMCNGKILPGGFKEIVQ